MRLDKRAFRSALGQDLPEARAKLAVNIRSRLDQGQKAGGPPRPVCPNAGSEETSLRERCKIERMVADGHEQARIASRSEEHTSELQSLMRISYAVFCLKKKNNHIIRPSQQYMTPYYYSSIITPLSISY